LVAGAIAEGIRFDQAKWACWADLAVRVLWAAVTLAFAAGLIALPLLYGARFSLLGAVGAVVLTAATLWARRGAMPVPAGIAGMAAAFGLALTLDVAPGLDRLWLSRSAASLVASHPPQAGDPLVAVGYDEPSLVFLLGTRLHLAGAREAAELLDRGGEVLVSEPERRSLQQALGERGLVARPLGDASGIDYSVGRRVILTLYDVERG
jgi:hypothetical protein